MRTPRVVLITCLFALLLAGCGPVEVFLEPGPLGGPVPSATAPPALITPTPIPTPEPSATPVVALTGLLQGGLLLDVVQTHMLSPQIGWAVARVDSDLYDHLMVTTDGGKTWQDRTPQAALAGAPPQGLIVTAHFASAQMAWAAYSSGGPAGDDFPALVWRTIDGGQSWAASQPLDLPVTAGPGVYQPVHLGFRDGRNGWLLARLSGETAGSDEAAIFITADGGYLWEPAVTPQSHPELMRCRQSGLAFPVQATGWLSADCAGQDGGPFLFNSSDNGRAWQPVTLPAPTGQAADYLSSTANRCGIPGFVYVSTRSLVVNVRCLNGVSPLAWLYASGDGGRTWASRPLPAAYGFFSFANPDDGWFLGSDDPQFTLGGFLFQTADGGRSWNNITPVGWSGPINFTDAENGWVIARTGDREALVQTQNGGRAWAQLKPLSAGD